MLFIFMQLFDIKINILIQAPASLNYCDHKGVLNMTNDVSFSSNLYFVSSCWTAHWKLINDFS